MDILTYRYPTVQFSKRSVNEVFNEELSKASLLKIASGYISSNSLVELKKTIELNGRPRLEILIGMHFYEGFTSNQWNASKELNTYLKNNELGFVKIAKAVKFHGKIYSFRNTEDEIVSIVGSSNISSILDPLERLCEFDLRITDEKGKEIDEALTNMINTFGVSLETIEPKIVYSKNSTLESYNVERVSDSDLNNIINSLTDVHFEIPLKTEEKSNLNVFFGKGRENKRGYILPRPWYEVELIVPSRITADDNYPKGTFEVITDDGWKFNCKTSGDYSKNLRSENDLKILGRWIKGRLENAGVLKVGELFTNDVAKKYKRNSLSLTKIKNSENWYLDFKV